MTNPTTGGLIGPLTADEWCSLRLGDDDDPLQCCGETSDLRDAIFHVLRMGAQEHEGIALRAAWHIVEEHGDLGDHPILRKLHAFYVEGKPELAPDSALAEMMAVTPEHAELFIAAIPEAFELDSEEGRIVALGRIAPRVAHVLDRDERCRLTGLLAETVRLDVQQVAIVVDAWRGNVGLPVMPR
ncbi:hypothetical protein ABZ671_01625 [Micromonospora sp. NPDC006766]|uniref:hypothetical protein n=1 Tax=Micromonospora sp. NPDC006766 TaxID=3154778 RepID=UPI0033D09CB7